MDIQGITNEKEQGATSRRRLSWKPRLGSLKTTRQTMARLFREWAGGNVDDQDFRTGTWALSQIVGAYRVEKELEIETRLREIEDEIGRAK